MAASSVIVSYIMDPHQLESEPPQQLRTSRVFASIQRFWDVVLPFTASTEDYPPISSIPRTSPQRLENACPKPAFSVDELLRSSSPIAAPYLSDPSTLTVLYLAYGSNLSAETFLGRRGIRPISSMVVSAPSLRLTFDLPGIAYKEPCFANVALRKLPKPPKLPPGVPDVPDVLDVPDLPKPPPYGGGFPSPPSAQAHGDSEWKQGLIGVVYEVTPEDYAKIIKTEGGGAGYQDILVPCIEIPKPEPSIPEKPPPPVPELPRPFLAHTLYAPQIPKKPDDEGDDNDGHDGDDDDGDDDGDEKCPLDKLKDKIKKRWRDMLLQPIRPDPEYAQPSSRYLQLIVDGADEHDLPVEYQRWLASLQTYTITRRLQKVGQYLFLGLVAPFLLLLLVLSWYFSDEQGRVPVWFAVGAETFLHLVWTVYDRGFKPVFGEGERTVDDNDEEQGPISMGSVKRARDIEDEKCALMDM